MENPGPSYSAEKTSQKMFIGTDKISEILNDSDSDVGSCSELLLLLLLLLLLYSETIEEGLIWLPTT